MSTHTPGRLMTQVESYAIADTGDYEYTYNIRSAKTLKLMAIVVDALGEDDEANARRLVAAWNACDGYDTEELESEDLMTLFQCRTISKLMDAKTQRDELATALSGLLSYFESGNSVSVDKATIKADSPEVIAARAAIQKVEGK